MKNKLGVKALCVASTVSILLSFKLPAFAVIGNDKEGTEIVLMIKRDSKDEKNYYRTKCGNSLPT